MCHYVSLRASLYYYDPIGNWAREHDTRLQPPCSTTPCHTSLKLCTTSALPYKLRKPERRARNRRRFRLGHGCRLAGAFRCAACPRLARVPIIAFDLQSEEAGAAVRQSQPFARSRAYRQCRRNAKRQCSFRALPLGAWPCNYDSSSLQGHTFRWRIQRCAFQLRGRKTGGARTQDRCLAGHCLH